MLGIVGSSNQKYSSKLNWELRENESITLLAKNYKEKGWFPRKAPLFTLLLRGFDNANPYMETW